MSRLCTGLVSKQLIGQRGWRYTTPMVGAEGSKYLPNNNPNFTEGFTEELSGVGLEEEAGFSLNEDSIQCCCQKDKIYQGAGSDGKRGHGGLPGLEAWHVLSLNTILSPPPPPISHFPYFQSLKLQLCFTKYKFKTRFSARSHNRKCSACPSTGDVCQFHWV